MENIKHVLRIGNEKIGEMAHAAICEIVKAIASSFGLNYVKPIKDDNHWYGVAAQLIGYIYMFQVRLNELFIGYSKFTVSKSA